MSARAILLTRPAERATRTRETLSGMGHEVFVLPLLQLQPLPGELAQQLEPPPQVVAFTSPSAVEFFAAAGGAGVAWGGVSFWALGAATARAVADAGLPTARCAGEPHALGLAKAMQSELPAGCRILLPGARIRRPDLEEALDAAGFALRRWDLYDTMPIDELPSSLQSRLREGWQPLVLLYSPSAVRAWHQLLAQHDLPADCAPLALFGPTTADQARELGMRAEIAMDEADEADFLSRVGAWCAAG